MKTEYIHLNGQPYQTIRIDRFDDDEAILTVTNAPLSSIGDLIDQLKLIQSAERHGEPIQMTAVLGAKPDPTAWYKTALTNAAKTAPEAKVEPAQDSEWLPDMPKPMIGAGILNIRAIATKTHKRAGKTIYGGTPNPRHCADLVKGEWIRLYGLSDERDHYDPETGKHSRYCTAYDITFNIGDTCEYGSYNFIYTGTIIGISEKIILIKHHGDQHTRLDLHSFNWRNWDYDEEKIAKHNAIESQVQ
jgi:hypothetical protein